jgi:hypothetical protein
MESHPTLFHPFCQRNESFVLTSASPWSGSALPDTIGTFNGVLDIYVLDKLYSSFWMVKEVNNRPSSNWGIDLNGITRFRLGQRIAIISSRQYDVSFKMIRSSSPVCPPKIVDRTGFLVLQSERLSIKANYDYTWETYSTSFKANSNSMDLSFESENQGPCGIILSDVVNQIVPETLPLPEPVLVPTVPMTKQKSEDSGGSEVLLDPEESQEGSSSLIGSIDGSEKEPAADESNPVNLSVSATIANPLADGGSNLEFAVEKNLQNTPENQSLEDKTFIGQKDGSSVQNEPSSKTKSKIIPIAGVCGALFVALVILLCGFLWQKRKKEPVSPFKTRYSENSRTASFTWTARTARTTNTSSIRTGATSMVSCDSMVSKGSDSMSSMQFSVVTSEV